MTVSIPSGTVFCDSTVIARVTISGDFPAGSKLQSITLRVYEGYEGYDVYAKYQDIRWEYDPGQQTYYKDIHTALSALMPLPTFNPNNVTVGSSGRMDQIGYGVCVGISYLKEDKETKTKTWYDSFDEDIGDYVGSSGGTAIRGRLTDYELQSLGQDSALAVSKSLSRKPVDEIEIIGNIAGMSSPIISTSSARNGSAPTFCFERFDREKHKRVYLDTTPDTYRLFCFINGLGCPELVYARTLKSMGVTVDKSIFSRERQVGYGADMMGTDVGVQNSPVAQTYSMSSGAVSRQWALWWATEFLTASRYWIWQDTMWVPCTVTADKKEVQIYNRAKAESPCINFNVKMGMSGVPQLSRF